MKTLLRNWVLGLGSALLLAACGGGGGGETERVSAPVATASAAQARVEIGTEVSLTGSATSPNGGTPSYRWSVAGAPDGSQAAPASPTMATTSFTPDLAGNYRIQLVANDGRASSSPAEVLLVAYSTRPVANAGLDTNIQLGTVQLDGNASQPPEGGDAARLTFQWTLVAKPDGSTAALDDATLAQPRFTADKAGAYRARLVVGYDGKSSDADEVTVQVLDVNVPPQAVFTINGAEAKPGATLEVARGQKVVLDASASTDPDRTADALQYRWKVTRSGLFLSPQVDVEGAASAVASFVPDRKANYSVSLTVSDGVSQTTPIATRASAIVPAGSPNAAPVVASPLPLYGSNSYEVEVGASYRFTDELTAHDPDGDSLTWEWTWLSYPAGFTPDFTSGTGNTTFDRSSFSFYSSKFTPSVAGEYKVSLRVYDGKAYSNTVTQTYTARLGANRAPTAVAKIGNGNPSILVGNTAVFDGTGSSDPDTNALSYAWTLVDRPDGSAAELRGATSANPSLTVDKAGSYTARLVVTDSHGTPSAKAADVSIWSKRVNHAPAVRVALGQNYTDEQPYLIQPWVDVTRTSTVNGNKTVYERRDGVVLTSNAYDADGDILSYLWELVQEPAGNVFKYVYHHAPNSGYNTCNNGNVIVIPNDTALAIEGKSALQWLEGMLALRSWSCANIGLAPTVEGTYQVQVSVYDGTERVGPFAKSFKAVSRANYPSLILEKWQGNYNRFTNAFVPYVDGANSYGSNGQQVVFPYVSDLQPWTLVATESAANNTVGAYRLTAVGGDYTIRDLATSMSEAGISGRFEGLADGQTIRKGESVVFSLYVNPHAQKVTAAQSVTWSFGIAEKPGWTFAHRTPVWN